MINVFAITAKTTKMVATVPTADKYDNNFGVRNKAVGMHNAHVKIMSCVILLRLGTNSFMCSPMLTIKIAKHENNSKYNTHDNTMPPVRPNAFRAISGYDFMGGNILAALLLGVPGGIGDLKGEENVGFENSLVGLGSPFKHLPMSIAVRQQTTAKRHNTSVPSIQPADLHTNGSPRSPTPLV